MRPLYRNLTCALVVIILSALGLLSGFVIPHQTSTCLDNYCYCENVTVGALILQPISYYSCISFYVVALLICYISDSSYPTWYLLCNIFLICSIGITSMIFHAHQSVEGEYLDGLSISLYVWFVFILENPWLKTLATIGSALIVGLLFVEGGLLVLFAVLVSLLGLKLLLRFECQVFYPLVSISIGFAFWYRSRDETGCSITFGHGVWHVFTAITIFILYIQEKPTKYVGIEISRDRFLLTGASQYHQIWTRDTTMSLIALLSINSEAKPLKIEGEELLKYIYRFLLIYRNRQAPRTLKGPMVFEKGLCHPSCRFFGWTMPCGLTYWKGWDYTSIDGDLLTEILMRQAKIKFAIVFFAGYKFQDGFITQGPWSDFQDSRDRSPITFLTNLFYWRVLHLREAQDVFAPKLSVAFGKRLRAEFYSEQDGLYRSLYRDSRNRVYFCLQDQLFAMLLEFDTRTAFRNTVKEKWSTQYASSVLGRTYVDAEVPVHWIPRCVGLRHYHDSMQWPWLAYFYGAMTGTQVKIPVHKRYHEVLDGDTELYSSERNFLLSVSFFYFYMYKRSEKGSPA